MKKEHRPRDARCWNAKTKNCTCECGGQNHGKGTNGEASLFDADRIDAASVHPRYRSKTNYSIISDKKNGPLIIKDQGPWDKFMTVTNAAEFVVQELRAKLPAGRRFFYYDSDGSFDELLIRNGKFAGFKHAGPTKAEYYSSANQVNP